MRSAEAEAKAKGRRPHGLAANSEVEAVVVVEHGRCDGVKQTKSSIFTKNTYILHTPRRERRMNDTAGCKVATSSYSHFISQALRGRQRSRAERSDADVRRSEADADAEQSRPGEAQSRSISIFLLFVP
jgi:hypothetical protein